MTFRVTPNVYISTAIENTQRHTTALAKLQQQAATGLRVLRPSDDPVAARVLVGQKSVDRSLQAQISAIGEARSVLDYGVSQLLDANRAFVKARDVALAANQATDPTELAAFAAEIDPLIDRLLSVANSTRDGRYVFSGTATGTEPFRVDAVNANGEPAAISYYGSTEAATAAIDANYVLSLYETGAEIFGSRQRGETIYIGKTGAAAGAGTDSGVGQATLIVKHTSTTYAGTSGVAPGTGSATGDTIIGPAGAHTIDINDTSGTGASGTVTLNGGEPVAFTSSDTNLKVEGPSGEVVYIDTSAISAGFNGTASITADGTLSVDGGLTEAAIDFSADQIVTEGNTGAVTHIDSTSIRRAGSDHLEYTGTADAFTALIQLRDELQELRGLPPDQWHDAIARRIDDLDRVRTGILAAVGDQSVQLQNLDALENRTLELQLTTRRTISELESADISEVAIKLQQEQTLLQFTLASTVRLFDQSLLDFLR